MMKPLFCVDIVVNGYLPPVDPCEGLDKLKRVTFLDGVEQLFPHDHSGEREGRQQRNTKGKAG